MKTYPHDITSMPTNSRYIKGFIKTIRGQVDLKWDIGQKMDDNTASIPIKKLKNRIKLFNE
jgi:hypothetical protein